MNVRFLPWLLWITVLSAAAAAPVGAEEISGKAVRDEIRVLRQMVLELQKRIRDLEADRVKPEPGEMGTDEEIADAAPVPESKKPHRPGGPPAPLELGGHEVRVGIAGAIQADVIHDFNAVGLTPGDGMPREFITANIPVGGPAADRTNRTAFSPNQSYLSGWAETHTPWGPLKVYADVNLMGSTTETRFQIYKVYGVWGWLKAGLDDTIWMNQAAIPSTLDFEGPNAAPENRFAQARLKIPLQPEAEKGKLFFTIGVEDAEGDITLPSGVADISSVNQFPALIGKFSFEPGWTRLELAGLYRRLKAEGDGYAQSVDGWGISFSGGIDTWGRDNFVWGIEYGKALGAYIQDTSGLGLDAAPVSAGNPDLRAIPAFGLWAGYQHWWSESWRSSVTYGFVRLDSDFNLFPSPSGTGTYKQTQYASMNLVWSPRPPFDVGLEYMFGERRVTDMTAVDGNTRGRNHRVQFTMRWRFKWER